MLIGFGCGDAAARSSFYKPKLEEEGLVHLAYRIWLLGERRRKCRDSRRAAVKALYKHLEQLPVEPAQQARVVIDENTGVIVMGENVRISTVAIAQGNLTIRVTETPQVSQPGPLSGGQTTTVPLGNLLIASNSWLLCTNSTQTFLNISNNATVQAGGGILLDGYGSPGGAGTGAAMPNTDGHGRKGRVRDLNNPSNKAGFNSGRDQRDEKDRRDECDPQGI